MNRGTAKHLLIYGFAVLSVMFLFHTTQYHQSLTKFWNYTTVERPATNKGDFLLLNITDDTYVIANSGEEFSGSVFRTFPKEKVRFTSYSIFANTNIKHMKPCSNWAVMTSIFEPSEAVRRLTYMRNWCIVVVGDLRSPEKYEMLSSNLRGVDVIFLNYQSQIQMKSEFVSALPWNSFGRKNIGFLYAIKRGARVIWDFDDDNCLKFWLEGASPDSDLFLDSHSSMSSDVRIPITTVQSETGNLFFNPYPHLGADISTTWPRGFPLSEILSKNNWTFTGEVIDANRIGVLQSLADHQPDVDAIHRMTHRDIFSFDASKITDMDKSSKYLMLSPGVYSPMNAQATLYFYDAFFTLYLPISVSGRVSDIWRSYIGQGLMALYGLQSGFIRRSLVDQDRNPHVLDGDFMSEIPLYTQTKTFVKVINQWLKTKLQSNEHKTRTMESLMEELYINLYERGFIEIEDVENVQLWLEDLAGIYSPIHANLHSKTQSRNRTWTNYYIGEPIVVDSIVSSEPSCHKNDTKPLVFWTSDLHDGARLEYPTLLARLGQVVKIAGIKKDRTPYPEAFKHPNIRVYTDKLSEELSEYNSHSTSISDKMVYKNVQFFKNLADFQDVDAVFCSFPASMCQLWMPFNESKSILFLPSHRYNLGRCTVSSWTHLNEQLTDLLSYNKLRKKPLHVVGAMSRYDYEYLRYYTGLEGIYLLPSFAGFYTYGHTYSPTKSEILVFGNSMPEFMKQISSVKLVHYRQKYKRYTLKDLVSHPAIIHMPYSVMSHKFTELYSLSIPLFVPSPRYFREHGGLGTDRTSTSFPYCKNDDQLYSKMPKNHRSFHYYNPNMEFHRSPEHEMYWLQFSDFYDLPHVVYFDNKTDLVAKLQTTDFITVHKLMEVENRIKKHRLVNNWCKIIQSLRT